MEEITNLAFGRKVFFVAPSFAIKNILINRLIDSEYEVYIIENYRDAKNILRQCPDSVCFVDVDEIMAHDAWFNFMKTCEREEGLKSILFGVCSGSMNRHMRQNYMSLLELKAGFISMNESMEDACEAVEGILKANGAKGRRQYVRCSCVNDSDAFMLAQVGQKALKLGLLDISVVGAACDVDVADKDFFKQNEMLRNASFSLDGKTFSVDTVVYAVIQTENFCKLVLLFIQPVSPHVKQTIRTYISASLHHEIEMIASSCLEDQENYSRMMD